MTTPRTSAVAPSADALDRTRVVDDGARDARRGDDALAPLRARAISSPRVAHDARAWELARMIFARAQASTTARGARVRMSEVEWRRGTKARRGVRASSHGCARLVTLGNKINNFYDVHVGTASVTVASASSVSPGTASCASWSWKCSRKCSRSSKSCTVEMM